MSLGPYGGPKGGAASCERGTPLDTTRFSGGSWRSLSLFGLTKVDRFVPQTHIVDLRDLSLQFSLALTPTRGGVYCEARTLGRARLGASTWQAI